jgi:hypothetical protein
LETEWTKDVTAREERWKQEKLRRAEQIKNQTACLEEHRKQEEEARLERERLAAEEKATLLAAEKAAEEKRPTEEAVAKE